MLKVTAIDVGSNALRMTVAEVDDPWNVKAIENIRIPVRLGEDVFTGGMLEGKSMQHAEDTFRRFKRVAKDMGVYRLRVIATSAMGAIQDLEIHLRTLTDFAASAYVFDPKPALRFYEKRHTETISAYLDEMDALNTFWRTTPDRPFSWEEVP